MRFKLLCKSLLIFIGAQTYASDKVCYLNDPYITYETYPNPEHTPGDIFPDVTWKDICTPGYARSIRNVSHETKRKIKLLYGIEPSHFENYTIDHFVPLSLGGTNEPTNLWPQRVRGIVYGAEQKSLSDNYLYHEVCEGRLTLEEAQKMIRDNWVSVYRQFCEFSITKTKSIPKRKRKKKTLWINGRVYDLSVYHDVSFFE